MFYTDVNETVYPSERTLRFLNSQDQPEFFKDICSRFQFPNGMDSTATLVKRVNDNISFKPFAFILEVLSIADKKGFNISKNEVAYFILNSLQVLQSKIQPDDVVNKIIVYRNNDIKVKVQTQGKETSYSMQHITEQLNLLELANLIRIEKGILFLNPLEKKAITYIRSLLNKKLAFDFLNYDLKDIEGRKKLFFDWQLYFAQIDKQGVNLFDTSVEAIQFNIKRKSKEGIDKIQLGDDGELFVYNYEKDRVSKYDSRLVNKVLMLGKTRGLGYDIQSIVADNSENSEFVQYIEVKSTIRISVPTQTEDGWIDSVNLTRNEWIAAIQHKQAFSIYRVYFTPEKVIIYIIKNPFEKKTNGSLKCTPMNYRLDFSPNSIDSKIEAIQT